MNQKQILESLTGQFTGYELKEFAAKLSKIFPFIKTLKALPGYCVNVSGEIGNVTLVNSLPEINEAKYKSKYLFEQHEKSQRNARYLYGNFETWAKVTFTHATGEYNIHIPVNCKFYSAFMAEIGVNTFEAANNTEVIEKIEVPASIIGKIGKAIPYTTKDDLRPVMQHVCIEFEGENCQVIATDAHVLYRSEKINISGRVGDRSQYLISATDAKKISKIKTKEKTVLFEVLAGDIVRIAGIECNLFTAAKFPDYRVVIPEYEGKMVFNRDQFAAGVKKLLPFSNKSTGQIVFHLNGSIGMKAKDIDFQFECEAEMPYQEKTFEDTDISFNGKYLLQIMDTFKKSNSITMLSDGQPTRAGLFTDGIDTVLAMPLFINDSYRY